MQPVNRERGFSLLELTTVLGVITVVMGIAFSLMNGFQQRYKFEEAYADAQRNGRFAVARLNEIIRSAGTNPTLNVAVNQNDFIELLAPVTVIGTRHESASIRLKSDLNGDTLNITTVGANTDVIVTSEDVTIQLDAPSRRIILVDNTPAGAGAVPIADSIIALTFGDPDGSKRAIEVNIRAVPSGVEPGDARYREVNYTTMIRLRNR